MDYKGPLEFNQHELDSSKENTDKPSLNETYVKEYDRSISSPPKENDGYGYRVDNEYDVDDSVDGEKGEVRSTEVKRALKPRHIGMIALGGTIGTGLFVGISEPLQNAGPVGMLIAYLFMATIAFSVMQSLGEMATYIPVTSAFSVFSQRFLSPAFGAANGYMYWFSWSITFALELSVIGQIVQYWTFKVPVAAWISIFWVLIAGLNFCPVKFYGEFEFWIAFIKVVAIVGFIIYCFIMVCGAGKTGPVGFRYWRHGYAFGDGIISKNKNEARFLGWVSSLINAAFTYQGTELVGITAGEAANPRKTVPKSIKRTLWRILIFYIFSLLFVGLLVPFNDHGLQDSRSYAASSPFILAIKNSGTKALPDIFNAVILTTVISAANSDVYVGSRVMYSMARNRLAPPILAKASKGGVPYAAVLFTSAIGALAYLETSSSGANVFNWLMNITGVAGFFSWWLISWSHLRFMKALKQRGISRNDLPFKASFMPWIAIYSFFFMTLIILVQGFTCFTPHFQASDFVASYISVGLFFVIWAVFQIWFRCPLLVPIAEIDIDTDRRDVDAEVWEDEPPKTLWDKFWNIVA
ncbi:ZYRO0F16654p [Zygosaccharomyces rouxii]|uniref:ZYRO0F16654p n=2 Tax=Zygosaccharomyces rouxii TaxID=4956 RepID=C5DYY1_ZYGRC|nr:uncharacterized protein ZYRO0F16654g [Zygosaccharomyces rouxii]KAH9201296.1 basic amino-acid permease [Zygosaccharomyces rouxii]CAQ43382.1 Basic amino-acid permease and Arginine permease [Zygosaccharomyces rouxii]CAR28992.1 ZYRO0F16654p [Zygosaccharomyces rouxii]